MIDDPLSDLGSSLRRRLVFFFGKLKVDNVTSVFFNCMTETKSAEIPTPLQSALQAGQLRYGIRNSPEPVLIDLGMEALGVVAQNALPAAQL